MILGILSDTHGQHRRTAAALQMLRQLGAEAFVHCGDVGGAAVFELFAGLPTWFVWGNTDFPDETLQRYVASLGITVPHSIPARIEVDGCSIAVYHGHEAQFTRLTRQIEQRNLTTFSELTAGWNYILFGHTHRPADTRLDPVRLINPGAVQRARPPTVATLDLARDALKFWVVDPHAPDGQQPRQFLPD